MQFTSDMAKAMMKGIKDNHATLSRCAKHQFGQVVGDRSEGYAPGADTRTCINCGGKMRDTLIVTYAKGYKAAGGNPDDIGLFVDGQALC